MTRAQLVKALTSPETVNLYSEADRVRKEYMGDAVHLRGLIEFSNVCGRDCLYCGIRRSNKDVFRYKMPVDEIVKTAENAKKLGYKSLVLQSGENCQYSLKEMCNVISRI